MLSAAQHHTVVSEYVANEKALGHFQGPIAKPQPNIHINRFGVIPKGHYPGASGRPLPPRSGMGGSGVLRHQITIWPEISTKIFNAVTDGLE